MASKFVKKKNFGQLRESRPVSKHLSNEHKTLPLIQKRKVRGLLEASINLSGRHPNYSHGEKQRSFLPHVFAVVGVVCGGNSNENENSAKSGISQDVTDVTNISKNSF